jgi:membrane protease YdiL (CAAX protease family)
MKRWVGRHPVVSFFIAAYAISWSIAVPLALQAHGLSAARLPWFLHYLTAFGPALAAFAIARLVRPADATKTAETGRPQSTGRSIAWWTLGCGAPLLLFALAQVAARLAGSAGPAWTALGRINFLPNLGLWAWGFWFLTSGVGEELGWRGFALPRLQRTHSAMTSTLLLTLAWAGWHLPAFFYLPGYRAMGLLVVPAFFLGLFAGAIVLTWVYNTSGGSVLAAALWHASFNFVTASPDAGGLVAAMISTFVMIWAFVIVWRYDWATLAYRFTRPVRATREEQTRTLPGDALIPNSIASLTHAISIRRPRQQVWPWLAQMGAGNRGGWYSYDFFDNGRRPSADRIIPELQTLTVGMIFPALPGITEGFIVLDFQLDRFLVLGFVAPSGACRSTWTFVLEDGGDGSTRVIVRARGGRDYELFGLPWWAVTRVMQLVHFVMQRRQLLGIAERVETHSRPNGTGESRSGTNREQESRTGTRHRNIEHTEPGTVVQPFHFRSCFAYGKSLTRFPVIWKIASPMADCTDVARSCAMPISQCPVGKKRMLISGGSSSMCEIGNRLKLFSTMRPSLMVQIWCMASL